MVQVTEDSIFSEEEIELFTKEENRNSLEFDSHLSQVESTVQTVTNSNRMNQRHQTARVSPAREQFRDSF